MGVGVKGRASASAPIHLARTGQRVGGRGAAPCAPPGGSGPARTGGIGSREKWRIFAPPRQNSRRICTSMTLPASLSNNLCRYVGVLERHFGAELVSVVVFGSQSRG